MVAQTGSVQWYKDMAGKLKSVTSELHTGRLCLKYGIDVTCTDQIQGLINKYSASLDRHFKAIVSLMWVNPDKENNYKGFLTERLPVWYMSGCDTWKKPIEFTEQDFKNIFIAYPKERDVIPPLFNMDKLWRESEKSWPGNPLKEMYKQPRRFFLDKDGVKKEYPLTENEVWSKEEIEKQIALNKQVISERVLYSEPTEEHAKYLKETGNDKKSFEDLWEELKNKLKGEK